MTLDASTLPELTRRQEDILTLIVHYYTEMVEPVASKQLVERLGVSSATIRNDMAVLEELGYIAAPHTSAGRVPTEKGYRYFVKHLVGSNDLSSHERTLIAEKLQLAPIAGDQWMRAAASILARTSRSASLVTPPIAENNRFKHIELISIQGRLVLMVLVLHGGTVHQRMLNLAEPVPQDVLSTVANRINTLCPDLSANELRIKGVNLSMLEREVVDLAADLMEQADGSQTRQIYREGLSEVIRAFQDQQGAQQVVRVFEERAFMDTLLTDMLPSTVNRVQVFVAGDGREELSQLSIVLSRYGVQGQLSGAIGVLGPTHINYGRAISAVRFVSSLMTHMVAALYAADDKGLPPGE
ncbi:MAG: heat-inducible transcription repressor HrcA [Chloroflexi bacterium]|nr:heat-inducible transcription repressor HrcA [Chloroflexota bacterium]